MKATKRFAFLVAPLAFLSTVCFFEINSWRADQIGNGWFIGAGVLFGLLAIWQLIKVIKTSN